MRLGRSMIGVPFVLVVFTACGISGNGGDDDSKKTGIEFRNLEVAPSDSSALVRWNTTGQAVCNTAYGKNSAALSQSISSGPGTAHEITIAALDPDTEYWFQISASTPLGQRASTRPASFRTLVSPDLADLTPPVFSDIQVTAIGTNSATVTWRTDDRAHGQLFYGTSESYGSTLSEPAIGFVRSHALTLPGLTDDTQYHFRLSAVNRANLSAYSADQVFRTAENPTIAIVPDTIPISDGEDFEFRIQVRQVTNLAGVSFMIAYEPDMVELESIERGAWFAETNGFMGPLTEYENDVSGRAQYAMTWEIEFANGVATGTRADGAGDIAVVHCRAKALAERGSLRLIVVDESGDGVPETRLLDQNRLPMTFNVRNAVVVRQGL